MSIVDTQLDEAKRLLKEWGKWAVINAGTPSCRTNLFEVIASKVGSNSLGPNIDDETAMKVDEAIASLKQDDYMAFRCITRHFVPPMQCYADIANDLDIGMRRVEAHISAGLIRVSSALNTNIHLGLSWIYFIQPVNGGPVKIGRSTDVKKRLRELQRGHPEKLHVVAKFLGTRESETYLHRKLADYRLNGEWFRASGMVAEVVRQVRSGEYEDLLTYCARAA